MDKKRGRKPEFRNVAEKQKAYRERQKQQKSASEIALWLIEEVENEKVTLLKSVDWHKKKGKAIEVRLVEPAILDYNPRPSLYADNSYVTNIDLTLFRYLVKTGQLVFKEKHWAGDKYIFKE